MSEGNYIDVCDAESCYVGGGRDLLLSMFPSIFWPFLAWEGIQIARRSASLDEVHQGLYQVCRPKQLRASSIWDAYHDLCKGLIFASNKELHGPDHGI